MKVIYFIFSAILILSCQFCTSQNKESEQFFFNTSKDLLLAHYDCKTDVDDLHSIAAFGALLSLPAFNSINYHAVTGTYGKQEGLYVPPNILFKKAFGHNWSDAHTNRSDALNKVQAISLETLKNHGQIWIAEAGQSDFSASLISLLQDSFALSELQQKIHIVQHSDWNESKTTIEHLKKVKQFTNYHKIPDGNFEVNGSPFFNQAATIDYIDILKNQKMIDLWKQTISLANQYNGKEGRYLNKTIKNNGLDFSDFSEIRYILNLSNIHNIEDYFLFLNN